MKRSAAPLRRQVFLFALLISGAVLLSVGGILFAHHLGQARARLADSLLSTARITAANASAAVAFRDARAASEILRSLRHNPLIVGAVLYDREGRPFCAHGSPAPAMPDPGDPSAAVTVDVIHEGEPLGRLLVVADNRAELRRTALTWAGVYAGAFALTVLLALGLAARFQRIVAEPITRLARTAHEVTSRRDYSVRAAIAGPAEVAGLAAAFNTMLGEVGRRDETLARQLVALDQEVRERKAAQETLRQNTRDMLRLSREAGMAEVAAGVLHDIGNALNSINVSAELLSDHMRGRAHASARALHDFLAAPPTRAAAVLASPPDGPALRDFLVAYAEHTVSNLRKADEELAALRAAVAHLKEIVARQQTLAKSPRRSEPFDLEDALREALLIDKTEVGSAPLRIERIQEVDAPAVVHADRSAVVQILINLLANARAAIEAGAPPAPLLQVRLGPATPSHLALSVTDNGIGIPADQLLSIFSYGFTTKAGGHGFGLHNAANTARLLGGALRVRSDGPGRGATFTLELPRRAPGADAHDA